MPTYVVLINWTEAGIRNVRDTVDRAEQARQGIERMGGRLTTLLWTQGRYDLVGVVEAPDDESVSAFALASAMQGSVRTETLRAYSAEEMRGILQRIPQG